MGKEKNYYCFLDKTRRCTENCRAAYKADDEIYCSIVWGAKEFGYAMADLQKKMESKKKPGKKAVKKK